MLSLNKSKALFEKAQRVLPGGVNSPVRAFNSVKGTPPFFERGKGAYLYDVDGNKYIDYVGSWGPLILGYSHPKVVEAIQKEASKATSFGAPAEVEIELAELITQLMPSVEMVRMVNSGTEATMSAIRLARGYTGRDKIIKFIGCYHGHGDSFLIQAGSGALTMGVPNSPGVTKAAAQDTLLAEFNNLNSVKKIIEANPEQIAAIIVEPVAGNMGVIPPAEGFLEGLRDLSTQNGIVFILDEVMTGFRVARGGAQDRFHIKPDLTTMGKIIGGGLPVGAYGGKKEIMQHIAPIGPVYQAGTLSGNPLAMRAGLETLKLLQEDGVYDELERKSAKFEAGMKDVLTGLNLSLFTTRVGSMGCLFFTDREVTDFSAATSSDTEKFAAYYWKMLEQGIYLAPSQFEAWFISLAHSDEDIDRTIEAAQTALKSID